MNTIASIKAILEEIHDITSGPAETRAELAHAVRESAATGLRLIQEAHKREWEANDREACRADAVADHCGKP